MLVAVALAVCGGQGGAPAPGSSDPHRRGVPLRVAAPREPAAGWVSCLTDAARQLHGPPVAFVGQLPCPLPPSAPDPGRRGPGSELALRPVLAAPAWFRLDRPPPGGSTI